MMVPFAGVGDSAGFSPTREDNDYAYDLAVLNAAAEGCDHAERVLLLLSTCRNQWLTANAVFVDLRLILEKPYDRQVVNLVAERVADGDTSEAEEIAGDAAFAASQASEKLSVWGDREALWAELQDSVQRLAPRDRERIALILDEHTRLRGRVSGRDDGAYLSISLVETARGRRVLDRLRDARTRLAAMAHVLRSIAVAEGRAREAAADAERLFATDSEPGDDGWRSFVEAVTTPRHADDRPASEILRIPALPLEATPEVRASAIETCFVRCEENFEAVRRELAEAFAPNEAEKPLPPPFELDFTPKHAPFAESGTSFVVQTGRASQDPPKPEAVVAILSCGVAESSYSHGELYQYRRTEERDVTSTVAEVARNAIDVAAERGADLLVMPECFIPYDVRDGVTARAEERGLPLVAGVEHESNRSGAAVNEAMIVLPGWSASTAQRKQRPSVYELKSPAFAGDGVLRVITGTALGTLAVVMCSDYLEFDLLWALASHEPRLDAIVVCSRNPNPEAFLRLAEADAARLHLNVILCNSRPDRGDEDAADGAGSGVVCPARDQPRLSAQETIPLDVEWAEGAGPELMVFKVPAEELADRKKGRTRPGYLKAPAFADMAVSES